MTRKREKFSDGRATFSRDSHFSSKNGKLERNPKRLRKHTTTMMNQRKPTTSVGSQEASPSLRNISTTSLGLVTLLMASSSASALITHRSRVVRPGPLGDKTVGGRSHMLSRVTTTTELLYAHGDFEDDDFRREEHRSATNALKSRVTDWWTTLFATSSVADVDEEQQVVDEYLEFLDRRYHRLHDDVNQKAPTQKPFSAWDWLMQDGDWKEPVFDAQKHEDALYVLGVAELASERLLQRHHIPLATQSVALADTQTIIDTQATTVVAPVMPLSSAKSPLFAQPRKPTVSSVLLRIQAKRRALIYYQEKQLKRLFLAAMRAIAKAPSKLGSTAKAVWQHGGGRKTLAISLTVLTALVVVLRPLVGILAGMIMDSGLSE